MRAWWRVPLLLSLVWSHAAPAAEPEPLQLLGRSSVEGYRVELNPTDWRWLRDKGHLRLGTSAPDYPPFENTINEHNFEGVTADFAALIAQLPRRLAILYAVLPVAEETGVGLREPGQRRFEQSDLLADGR